MSQSTWKFERDNNDKAAAKQQSSYVANAYHCLFIAKFLRLYPHDFPLPIANLSLIIQEGNNSPVTLSFNSSRVGYQVEERSIAVASEYDYTISCRGSRVTKETGVWFKEGVLVSLDTSRRVHAAYVNNSWNLHIGNFQLFDRGRYWFNASEETLRLVISTSENPHNYFG